MEKDKKDIIKKFLAIIESEGMYGFKLLNKIKQDNPEYDQTELYITLNTLKEQCLVEPYISKGDKECRVKIKYKISPKGQKLFDLMRKN